MIEEGQKVRAKRDIKGEAVSAGNIGTVWAVVDASKYGMGTLYSVWFVEEGEIRAPLLREQDFEPV